MQQYLQQTFAEIGVEMTIDNLPDCSHVGKILDAITSSIRAIVGITYLIGADPDVTNRFHSGAIAAQGGRGSNNSQYSECRSGCIARGRQPDLRSRLNGARIYRQGAGDHSPATCLFSRCIPSTNIYGHKAGIEGYRSEHQHAHRVLACRRLVLDLSA